MTIASLTGLSIELKKGEPKLCPPGMHDELLARGCVPETETPEPEPSVTPTAPTNPADRYAALCVAFEKLSLRNERTDFNAVGFPHAAALAKELGWTCSGKERDTAWAKWQSEGARK